MSIVANSLLWIQITAPIMAVVMIVKILYLYKETTKK